MKTPRGIRNNNPGNIEKGDPWQGLAKDQGRDPRFAVFEAPAWGIRALACTLITYQDRYGIRTVEDAIARWAPADENNTLAYQVSVARAVGVSTDQLVDFHDYGTLRPMVEAIIRHENGPGPLKTMSTWYDATTIDEGLRLAGVVQKRPVLATVEGKAAGAAVATGGAAAVVEVVNQVMPAITQVRTAAEQTAGLPGWVRTVIIALTLASAIAAGVVLWQKRRQRQATQ